MDIEAIRRYCLQFPHTTENVQWGADLCFKVDGKLFVVTGSIPVRRYGSASRHSRNFHELCERPGFVPRPTWPGRSGSPWSSSIPCPTPSCEI